MTPTQEARCITLATALETQHLPAFDIADSCYCAIALAMETLELEGFRDAWYARHHGGGTQAFIQNFFGISAGIFCYNYNGDPTEWRDHRFSAPGCAAAIRAAVAKEKTYDARKGSVAYQTFVSGLEHLLAQSAQGPAPQATRRDTSEVGCDTCVS